MSAIASECLFLTALGGSPINNATLPHVALAALPQIAILDALESVREHSNNASNLSMRSPLGGPRAMVADCHPYVSARSCTTCGQNVCFFVGPALGIRRSVRWASSSRSSMTSGCSNQFSLSFAMQCTINLVHQRLASATVELHPEPDFFPCWKKLVVIRDPVESFQRGVAWIAF